MLIIIIYYEYGLEIVLFATWFIVTGHPINISIEVSLLIYINIPLVK